MSSQEILKIENFSESDKTRFWGYVEKLATEAGCWIWTGGCTRSGYGGFWFKNSTFSSHRVATLLSIGEIDHSLFACHRCDTPSCVNPSHLFYATQKENLADCKSKGRHTHGVNSGRAKITEDDVREIRRMRKELGMKLSDIAKKFNLTAAAICWINKKGWKHI